jgi:hypothetical protein
MRTIRPGWRGSGRGPADPYYYVVMHDPEGNEFCVS